MAYSIRTSKYRYTEWQDLKNNRTIVARELYDFTEDVDESVNVVDQVEYTETVKKLSKMIENYRLKGTEGAKGGTKSWRFNHRQEACATLNGNETPLKQL